MSLFIICGLRWEVLEYKINRKMKKYQFRAVYFKNRKDGDIEYRSEPIPEAKEQYDTVGLYELSEEKDSIEQNHIADMSREDFQLILDSRFPNGFDSWQKCHYEVVSTLNKLNFQNRKSFYSLALQLTNKFETLNKEVSNRKGFSEEVFKFVESELSSKEYQLALLKDLS